MSGGAVVLIAVSVGAAALIVACGGSPSSPAPAVPPQRFTPQPVAPAPPNNLSVIESLTAKGRRGKEPANFADLAETLDLSATVHDDETPLEELEFQWSAPLGSFDGSGPSVKWTAPESADTPVRVTITLKVVEKYGYPDGPKIYQQDVSSSIDVSLHNSRAELDDMSRQFLLDFSDSNIGDVPQIMRNFLPGCYGTAEETAQVTENRRRYRIVESRVDAASTTINFGGLCAYGAKRGDACTAVPVFWRSLDLDHGNAEERVGGTDWLASVYVADKDRWFLCDSSFEGHRALHSTFIR
jgi:ABC-type transport system substrate-binding protein